MFYKFMITFYLKFIVNRLEANKAKIINKFVNFKI